MDQNLRSPGQGRMPQLGALLYRFFFGWEGSNPEKKIRYPYCNLRTKEGRIHQGLFWFGGLNIACWAQSEFPFGVMFTAETQRTLVQGLCLSTPSVSRLLVWLVSIRICQIFGFTISGSNLRQPVFKANARFQGEKYPSRVVLDWQAERASPCLRRKPHSDTAGFLRWAYLK